MSTVVICGAGVDKSDGIDMPLAAELVPRIRNFLKTDEGQVIDKSLRKILPNLHFSYDRFIKDAVDKLSNEFRGQVANIVECIGRQVESSELEESDRKLGKLIVALLIKIQKLQEDVRLDEATEILINDVFGGEITVEDDNIIDLPKLSFTDVFNTVMRKIFERSLNEPNHPILQHVRGNLMDFERLLMDSFIGFYTNSEPQMKNYMYLSWTLWAYLKHCETASISNGPTPFYSTLPDDWTMITLNYTSFARKRFGDNRALYFHGDLSSFIRMRDRQLIPIDNYDRVEIAAFIKDTVGQNTRFEKGKRPTCVVPSIVPPLKMKPVLSNAFIDIWYRSKDAIANAKKVVVVGYSFNYADEHFNDLIRRHKDREILVIDPYAEGVRDNLRNIFSHSADDYVSSQFQGKLCFCKDGLIIVKAKATELDWEKV
ncbi:MAG: hypothetical protein IT389_06000 [Nitrospira sp.]|nr:hypothetical protein [Nitrospira sp.]